MFDRGADGELDILVDPFDGLRHNMRGCVPENMLSLITLIIYRCELIAVLYFGGQVNTLSVNFKCDNQTAFIKLIEQFRLIGEINWLSIQGNLHLKLLLEKSSENREIQH